VKELLTKRYVLSGPASEELGRKICNLTGSEPLDCEFRTFPDGETKVTIKTKVSESNVVIVQSTYPPVDTHLMQLFFASHYLSQEGARVTAVIPYLAYSRQDKEFLPGEVVSIGVVAHLLRSSGVKRVVTVDIHSADAMAHFSFPIYSVSAIPYLASYVKEKFLIKKPVVVAPDFGASKRNEVFAKLVGGEMLQLAKKRDRITGKIKIVTSKLDVKERDVIVVDDIISTGGTLAEAASILYRGGAKDVIACCTHALLVNGAEERLRKAGITKIISTNTVPSKYSAVDVAEPIALHLKTINE
jgi:ribose-phosphate pyrophosphokinase